MRAALALGAARGVTPPALATRVGALITRLGPLPSVAGLRTSEVMAAVGRDKKVVAGTLHFIAASAAGATTVLTDVSPRQLRDAIRSLGVGR
jgi:3-dehydroquinate synthetase